MMNLARLAIQKPLLPYRCYHLTALSLAKIVENVPALGESITEGTIASWAKKVGDKVNADDVIVVIETDKVTVDVKAARSGVLTKQLAVDTVLVGKPLYEIEADSAVSSSSASSSSPPSPTPSLPSTHQAHTTRTPLIKFVGKRPRAKHDLPAPISVAPVQGAVQIAVPVSVQVQVPVPGSVKPVDVPYLRLKDTFMHGRPKMSAKEMDAITSGGAY